MTQANANDDESLVKNEVVYIKNNVIQKNVYSVYLTPEIGENKDYRELYNLFRTASEDDAFIIYMNNYGGFVHTGIEIINAMKACHGYINIVVSGPIYSMAPLIALNGDKLYIEEDVFMMFHDYSGSVRGKGGEQEAAILNDRPFFNSLFNKATKKFLTAREQKEILSGKDLYIHREEILKRLKKMGKLGNRDT